MDSVVTLIAVEIPKENNSENSVSKLSKKCLLNAKQ